MIPQRLELSDIQQAFRDFETKLGLLFNSDIDMKQRRIVGAAPSVAPFDYVTRYELDKAIASVETNVSVVDAPTALDLGFVIATTPLTTNAIMLGAGLNKAKVLGSLGTTTTLLHGNAAGAPTFASVNLATEVGTSILLPANGGTGVAYDRIAATLAFTTQSATLGPTVIASTGSQFRLSYTLLITTTDVGAATVTVSVNYTDDIGATSQAGAAVVDTGNNRQTGTFIIERASGNITYTVTVTGVIGNARFAFYATLERLS